MSPFVVMSPFLWRIFEYGGNNTIKESKNSRMQKAEQEMKLPARCGRFGVSLNTSALVLTSALLLLILQWIPTVRSGAIGEYYGGGTGTNEHDEDQHQLRHEQIVDASRVGGTGTTDDDDGPTTTTSSSSSSSPLSVSFEPYIFSNNMTLQRTLLDGDGSPDSKRSSKPTVIWGRAPPSTDLTLTVSTRGMWNFTSTPRGTWEFVVPTEALVEVATNLTVTVSASATAAVAVAVADDIGRGGDKAAAAGEAGEAAATPLTTTLHNVAVGDVYLCSGQSNMVFTANVACPTDRERCAAEMANSANYTDVRMMTVQRVSGDEPMPSLTNGTVGPEGWAGGWYPAGPESFDEVPGGRGDRGQAFTYFSAACYFFGRDLYDALNGTVPIGLISSSYGGTRVELWMRPEAIEECENLHDDGHASEGGPDAAATLDARREADGKSEHPLRAGDSSHKRTATKLRSLGSTSGDFDLVEDDLNSFADRPFVDFMEESVGAGGVSMGHSSLWNAMINPLLRFNLRGFVWYQGEANAADPALYGCLFASMIRDWRRQFFPVPAGGGPSSTGSNNDNRGTLVLTSESPPAPPVPFLFVQLAPFYMKKPVGKRQNWERIRYEQSSGGLSEPNVGMAVSLDLGDASSPWGDVHPRRKREVGRRLSLLARDMIYDDVDDRGDREVAATTTALATGPVMTGYCISRPDPSANTTLVVLHFDPSTSDGLHLAGSADCDEVGVGDGPSCCEASPFLVTTDDLVGPVNARAAASATAAQRFLDAGARAPPASRLDPALLLAARWTSLPSTAHEVRPSDSSVAVTVPLWSTRGVDGDDGPRAAVTGLALHWETVPPCILYNGRGGPDDGAGLPAAPFAIEVTWDSKEKEEGRGTREENNDDAGCEYYRVY